MTQATWQIALARRSAIARQARSVEEGITPDRPTGLDRLQALASIPADERSGSDYDALEEVKRICALPIQHPVAPEEFEAWCRENTKAALPEDDRDWKWKPEQAEACMAYESEHGAYLPLRVGSGKTITLQRIADLAYKRGRRKIVHLLPPNLVSQFMDYDVAYALARIPYDVPLHVLTGDMGPKRRDEVARSNRKGCYLLPYSILSRESSADILEIIQPDTILSDESFLLANYTSALTKRVDRYMSAHPQCEFVGAAGSITKRSITEFAHLIKWALKLRAPVPIIAQILTAWSAIVDTGAQPEVVGTTTIRPLMGWARRTFPSVTFPDEISGFRKAFRLRLVTTPGIVSSTGASDLNCSLTYVNRPVPDPEPDYPGWSELKSLVLSVERDMIAPTGDELKHKMEKFKWLNELSAGGYNDLWWPDPAIYAERKGISLGEAQTKIRQGKEHHQAQQAFNRHLRYFMDANPNAKGQDGRPIDSPLRVTQEMSLTGDASVDGDLYDLWVKKKALEVPGMAERDRGYVRVCDWKLRAAARWALSVPKPWGSIIWGQNRGLVKWLFEVLEQEGVEAMHCPRGANAEIRDVANGRYHKAASLKAYHKGFNLQHHRYMLFVQFPRDAMVAEQSVGRFHRMGQTALSLDVNLMLSTEHDRALFSACLLDALYQHQIGGGEQKLIYANYDPPLQAVDPLVLEERGIITNGGNLDQNHRRLLKEKFGSH